MPLRRLRPVFALLLIFGIYILSDPATREQDSGLLGSSREPAGGEYEWNERGGVIHWAHHDPKGRRAGGWLRHEGQHYD